MTTNVHQIQQPTTAWRSTPAFIRFAVWVWAISTVACVGLGWLIAVLWFGLR